ncbi:MAG: hypothetical protein J7521_20320 [Caulobacter sp.]|nr:hypothetical protein [Caulobacter sp.]
MSHFMMTYDLRAPGRNYDDLYKLLRENWKAKKVAESVWLAEINGTAGAIRDSMRSVVDSNDRIVVIELKSPGQWGTLHGIPEGVDWLKKNISA